MVRRDEDAQRFFVDYIQICYALLSPNAFTKKAAG